MAAEANPSEKSKLKKLARRLRSVHEELKEYSELLQRYISLPPTTAEASFVLLVFKFSLLAVHWEELKD